MQLADGYWRMAKQFVNLLYQESKCPVIVCDHEGTIRCSPDSKRIGTPHAGAQKIMSGVVDDMFVTAEDAAANPLVKEGYNCVIAYQGERIGTFGIAGKLEIVKPLARVASVLMSTQLKKLTQQEVIEEAAVRLFSDTDQMIENGQKSADALMESIRQTQLASDKALGNVAHTDEILDHIENLVAKTNILRINGAIEASRAGSHGRAFGVVVAEMKEMSEETQKAAVNIEKTLESVRVSIQHISDTMENFSEISSQQVEMQRHMASLVNALKETIESLSNEMDS